MATRLIVFRQLLAAAFAMAWSVPLVSAQLTTPTTPLTMNTFDLGLIADPGDPIVLSATSASSDPMNLYIFDSNAEVVMGSSTPFLSTLVAQLPQGSYLLAAWHGSTPPGDGYEFLNVATPQTYTLDVDGTLFDDSILCGAESIGDCFRSVRFYIFHVGEPTSLPLGRTLTSKARFDFFDFSLSPIGNSPDPNFTIFGEDGVPRGLNPIENQPGRYFLAFRQVGQASDRFSVSRPRGDDPMMFDLAFRGISTLTIGVPGSEVLWVSYEIRDEGPDTVAPVDFSELQPVPIAMTALQSGIAPSLALFRESDRALIDTAAMTGTARLADQTLEPGEYLVAANGAGTGYADGFTTLPLTSGPGTSFDYDIAIGVGRFVNQTIEPGGDTDFYRFTVEPTPNLGEIAEGPQAFTFETFSADPTRDTKLALYSDDGLLLSEDDNGGPGDLSRLDEAGGLPAGDYVIAAAGGGTEFADDFVPLVDGDEDSGDYALGYIGLTRHADLGFGGDVDMYRFQVGTPTDLGELGGPGDTITLNTIGSQFDTAIAVWDQNGVLLDVSNVPVNGLDSIERVYAPGVYHFGIAGSGAAFADGFRIDVSPAGPLGSYSGVAGGQLYGGDTSELDRFDLFRFEIAEPCSVSDVAIPFSTLDALDILVYLIRVENGTAPDFDGEAGLTFFDALAYLVTFDEGCP